MLRLHWRWAWLPPPTAQTPPLGPIDPDNGEQTLLDLIEALPINDVQTALNNFPVPYVVCASAGTAQTTCVNQRAGSPKRVDADQSKTTGQGGSGHDLEVEVNTELTPEPHLQLSINRLGAAPFASNLQVVVAFPFAAFNDETLPAPNLFFGYRTTAAFDGTVYPAGGHAPASVEYVITPHVLGGADHLLDLQVNTVGAANPVQFLGGHFDGTAATGVQNALGIAALADPVPASMTFGMDVAQNLFSPTPAATNSLFDLTYTASAPAKLIFNYLEGETFPFPGDEPDFATSVTFDRMPTSEHISIAADFVARTLTLSHQGSAPIGEIVLEHTRRDGLTVTGTASEVPTEVDVTIDFAGSATVGVNANTMDIDIVAEQVGGFPNTDGFLGYPLGYAQLTAQDVPDMTASYEPADDSFSVQAVNPGEQIGHVALVVGHDSVLELPPSWEDTPTHHIFSLVDTGADGTAAARLVHVRDATLTLDSSPLGETYDLLVGAPATPLQLFLDTEPASALTGTDVEVLCDVDDMPFGDVTFEIDFPTKVQMSSAPPGQIIDSITCAGHVGTLNFEIGLGSLPANSGFEFDPNGRLDVRVEPTGPNSGAIGFVTARFWDLTNPLPSSFGLSDLLGPLHDARLRADQIPSFTGTWSDGASTAIDFHAGTPDDNSLFVGGVQVVVSTVVELDAPLPVATLLSDDYLTATDLGAGNPKRLGVGVFGLTDFSYLSNDGAGSLVLDYAANTSRQLVVDVDTRHGGLFFPTYDIDAQLTVDSIPATWHLDTNLRTELHYAGSDGISSIGLTGDIDINGPPLDDRTHIVFGAEALPATVDFSLTPASGATLTMSDPIDLILLDLSSDVDIFGSGYRHIHASIEDIPAGWTAAWGTSPNPHASLNTTSPLGPVSLILSEDVAANTPSKYAPFTAPGGAVQYTPFAREIDRRYFRQGQGDNTIRETVYMARLDGLYNSTSQLDPDEDHVIIRDDFTSVQGTGFQCISAQSGPGSFQCVAGAVNAGEVNASLLLPVAGVHPLYVAVEGSGGQFTTVQVPDVPDSTSVVAGSSRANLDFSGSPGDILIYQGLLPGVSDFQDALKVQLIDTPSFVHASWDLGFPGGANVDSSNPFELRVLVQGGSDRTVIDFGVGDLAASWGINTAEFEFFECKDEIPLPPFFIECGTWFTIVDAFATFTATPAIEGFVANYQSQSNPQDLTL